MPEYYAMPSTHAAMPAANATRTLSSSGPLGRSASAVAAPMTSAAGQDAAESHTAPAVVTAAHAAEPTTVFPAVGRARDASRPAIDAAPSPAATAQSATTAGPGGRSTIAASIDAASQVAPVSVDRSCGRSIAPNAASNIRRPRTERWRTPSTSTAIASATVSSVRRSSGERTPTAQPTGNTAERRCSALRATSRPSGSAGRSAGGGRITSGDAGIPPRSASRLTA